MVNSTDGVSGYQGEEGNRELSGATGNPTTVAPISFYTQSIINLVKSFSRVMNRQVWCRVYSNNLLAVIREKQMSASVWATCSASAVRSDSVRPGINQIVDDLSVETDSFSQ